MDINELIKNINKKEVIPQNGLKQNSKYYSIISVVNNMICAYYSENCEFIPVSIFRFQNENVKVNMYNEHKEYYTLCISLMKMLKDNIGIISRNELWKEISII